MHSKIQKYLGVFLLFLSFQLIAQKSFVEIDSFGINKGNLKMFVYKPLGIKRSSPLVVVLHGCGQTAKRFAEQSGWNTLADSNKFIVIYPQQKVENNLNRCFNWFSETDISKEKGESNSIKEMINFSINNFKIDSSKIFAAGFSAGGAMANVLMANYPNIINSGAIISGIPFKAAHDLASGFAAMQGKVEKSSSEWVSLIKDNNPNYKGKYPKVVIFQGKNDPFVNNKNADIIELQWKGVNKLKTLPKVIKEFNGNIDVTKIIYSKNSKPIIVKYEINKLGHALSIDPGDKKYQGGKIGKFAIDKNFYSSFWIAHFFELVR